MTNPHAVLKASVAATNAAIIGDFRNFLFLVWDHLGLPDPTEVQYDIGWTLQHGEKRLIIEAFRGVGKSWITSAFVCWCLLVNPQVKILVVSASKSRADDFSTFTKRLIAEMPILQHLRARQGQRDSNIAFDVGPAAAAHAPSVKSLGITSQLTGSRADVIIPDDIEVPANSATVAQREKLSTLVKEFEALLTPKPDSRIIYLGTPQTEMSVYNELRNRGYRLMVWPARYPSEKQEEAYKGTLAPYIVKKLEEGALRGAPVDPARFSELELMQRELSYGRSGFALQFMLDTSLSDANRYPLKLADLVVMDLSPEVAPSTLAWASGAEQVIGDLPVVGLTGDRYHKPIFVSKEYLPYQSKALFIDPSGRGGDELAYAVLGFLHGRLFLLRWGGLAGGYDDANLELLAKMAKAEKVNLVKIEDNFGDGMFNKLFAPHLLKVGHPCLIEGKRHNVQKEKRIIDTLEPVMNQHKLVVDKRIIDEDYRLTETLELRGFFQMTRITKEKGCLSKDDRIDCLAMGVAHYVEQLSQDSDKAAESSRRKALEAELDSFHQHIFGITPASPSAISCFLPSIH